MKRQIKSRQQKPGAFTTVLCAVMVIATTQALFLLPLP